MLEFISQAAENEENSGGHDYRQGHGHGQGDEDCDSGGPLMMCSQALNILEDIMGDKNAQLAQQQQQQRNSFSNSNGNGNVRQRQNWLGEASNTPLYSEDGLPRTSSSVNDGGRPAMDLTHDSSVLYSTSSSGGPSASNTGARSGGSMVSSSSSSSNGTTSDAAEELSSQITAHVTRLFYAGSSVYGGTDSVRTGSKDYTDVGSDVGTARSSFSYATANDSITDRSDHVLARQNSGDSSTSTSGTGGVATISAIRDIRDLRDIRDREKSMSVDSISSLPSASQGKLMSRSWSRSGFRELLFYTGGALFHVEWCIKQFLYSFIKLCHITIIAHNYFADIYLF